jgi:hypothetical protein
MVDHEAVDGRRTKAVVQESYIFPVGILYEFWLWFVHLRTKCQTHPAILDRYETLHLY